MKLGSPLFPHCRTDRNVCVLRLCGHTPTCHSERVSFPFMQVDLFSLSFPLQVWPCVELTEYHRWYARGLGPLFLIPNHSSCPLSTAKRNAVCLAWSPAQEMQHLLCYRNILWWTNRLNKDKQNKTNDGLRFPWLHINQGCCWVLHSDTCKWQNSSNLAQVIFSFAWWAQNVQQNILLSLKCIRAFCWLGKAHM